MTVTERATRTGGREASARHIPPIHALAVGMPVAAPPPGWEWSPLTDLARLESGHTPSRRHPEYWGGSIPWISIPDARSHDGQRINETDEKTNALGIQNSSARILPENTVCLSRTASVGYVVVMGRPMATSQDFVNWVCSPALDHNFLKYLLLAEDEDLTRFASGSVHQTIYFPEVKAFHICRPSLPEQQRIVGTLDEAFAGLATAKANAEKNLQNARALFESYLQVVFTQRGGGWERKPLSSLCELISGQHIEAKDYNTEGQGVAYLTGPSDFGFINPLVSKWSEHPKRMASRGDILVTVKGSGVGKINLLDIEEVAISRQLMAIRAAPENVSYLYAFLSTRFDHFQSLSTGAAIPGISREDVLNMMCPMPPSSEQDAIVKLIHSIAQQTQRLETLYRQKLLALDDLKKSLLHQAFTGQLTAA
jgi:type I restriction enzyme S subunit